MTTNGVSQDCASLKSELKQACDCVVCLHHKQISPPQPTPPHPETRVK